ncbi:class I tRNA ligase family protein [Kribbella capetownensis]|uniref:class I tRNA ligase family protein n=1 Tax=Kribbella capetownensis TaxID=1572659 RepID=UPI00192DB33D|nr:class I tRNA ligase family protein [Kribbella capetownensis]
MADPVTVFTSPQPTVNGPLHVGHLAGPYLGADLAARAARARGERVVVTTGLDVHLNYVLTRAEGEGVEVGVMTAEFRDDIKATSAATPLREITLHACADCGRTLHESYLRGLCGECKAPAAGGACEQCGSLTQVDTMVDPVCGHCGGEPRPFAATVPVLRMEDHREALIAMWLRADLPPAVRDLIDRTLQARLPELALAYPTNWGLEGDGPLTGLRIGPYTEIALSDLYAVARGIDPEAADVPEYLTALTQVGSLWHFLGLDNAFWYALYWPAVRAAAGVARLPLSGLVVNEFYTFAGEKFSTSRKHGTGATELLRTEDPSIVRLFLAWDRPDRFRSDFSFNSFRAFAERVEPIARRRRERFRATRSRPFLDRTRPRRKRLAAGRIRSTAGGPQSAHAARRRHPGDRVTARRADRV